MVFLTLIVGTSAISLAYPVQVSDTLWIDSIGSHSGQQVVLDINFVNADSLVGIDLPLKYTYPDIFIDSVSFEGSRAAGRLTTVAVIDTIQAKIHIGALDLNPDLFPIPPGRGLLARLFVRVPDEYPSQIIVFDTTTIQTGLTFLNKALEWFAPVFHPGYISNAFAPALDDSIWIESIATRLGQRFMVNIYGKNELPVSTIYLPLSYSSAIIRFDSMTVSGTRSAGAEAVQIEPHLIDRTVYLCIVFTEAAPLGSGSGALAKIYFTTEPYGATPLVAIDTFRTGDIELAYNLGPFYGFLKSFPTFTPGLVEIDVSTDVTETEDLPLPKEYGLSQNYPNPFNPATSIGFALPRQCRVELDIFDILGRKIRTLVAGELPAGNHTVTFDGRNRDGKPVASGIYLYRLRTDEFELSKKMILLK